MTDTQRPLFPDFPLPEPEPEPDFDEVTAIAIIEKLGDTLKVEMPWDDHHTIDLAIQDAAKIIRDRRAARG
jgi:hypothetical protein